MASCWQKGCPYSAQKGSNYCAQHQKTEATAAATTRIPPAAAVNDDRDFEIVKLDTLPTFRVAAARACAENKSGIEKERRGAGGLCCELLQKDGSGSEVSHLCGLRLDLESGREKGGWEKMTDTELMQSIKNKYGALLSSLAPTSHVPPSFLAALIANESGGDPNAKRFEGAVLASLWQVLLARKANFGSIGGQDLRTFLIPPSAVITISPTNAAETIFGIVQRMDGLATSWGVTQIMGYEVLDTELGILPSMNTLALQDPRSSLPVSLKMLAQFASRNGLDLGSNFSEMFDCWNTGRPHAPTYDAQYIPRGLARKALYESLA